MHYEPTSKTISYAGTTYQLVTIIRDNGLPAAPEAGDPIYDLVDSNGMHRYTLRSTLGRLRGLPENQLGQVYSVEDTQTGTIVHGELLIEMADGWRYVDSRGTALRLHEHKS